jgi:site-specific DNA-methyltransferase (adenine-specific)
VANVTCLLGDCLEVSESILDKSIDSIITDLPYGVTQCAFDSVIPFVPMWAMVKRILKPGGVFVTTASQPFTSALVMSNPEWFKYEWIWEKDRATGHLDAENRPMRKHENVLVFAEGSNQYNPQIRRKPKENIRPVSRRAASDNYGAYKESAPRGIPLNMTYPQSILKINTANNDERGLHPNQKPVELYEYLILTYTNPGDIVLDISAGSGTTGEAAIKTGRNCILIEKDPANFDIMQARIKTALSHPALFQYDSPAPAPTQDSLFENA